MGALNRSGFSLVIIDLRVGVKHSEKESVSKETGASWAPRCFLSLGGSRISTGEGYSLWDLIDCSSPPRARFTRIHEQFEASTVPLGL